MPAPTISVYFNTIDQETTIGMTNISGKWLYWAGPQTTGSALDPVTREIYNKWVEKLWIADPSVFANGTIVSSYHPPGQTPNRCMFMIRLDSGTLSDVVQMTAFDNTLHTTWSSEIFGTDNTNYTSWLKAAPTGYIHSGNTLLLNVSAGWATFTTATTPQNDTPNALKGTVNYITWSSIPVVGDALLGILACVVPSDASAGSSGKTPVITVIYRWTE